MYNQKLIKMVKRLLIGVAAILCIVLGYSIAQVQQLIAASNMEIPAGKIKTRENSTSIRLLGKLQDVEQLRNLILASQNGVEIRLSDVADVQDTEEEAEKIDLGSLDTKELETEIQNSNTVKNSNTQNFSIEDTSKNIVDKIVVKDDNRLFLSSEEEEAYKSYVEEENYRQNKFSLNDFNKKLQSLRSQKKYFQIGMDMQIDGSDAANPSGMKGLDKINDLSFKVETGYLDKFFVRYAFVMERPDRIYRKDPSRNSTFDFRRHEFESKYMFSKDPDKPWWIGGKLQYVQNGAPKASDPEIYESSWYAKKVNKITLGMATLSHSFENVEWEIGAGVKWDKPDNKKLGYYPVITLKFGITPFPEKNIQFNYSGGSPSFGAGL